MEEKIIEIIENLTGYDKLKENVDIDLLENVDDEDKKAMREKEEKVLKSLDIVRE